MARNEITSVGKYRILSQIGEGAMGCVYRALDPVLNRPVAIKVMSEAVARDEDLRERFLREAQAAGSLQHPNLITIYDFGEIDGHLYIAMEFVEGEDLNDLLEKNLPLSLGQKVDILVDVLTGLSYAHKRGIVHRDIKPANIRIDDEGRARIMDFGIAHVTSSNMTRTGVMVGTPAYMAPEQIVGGPVSPATDIFSAGAVMYELLTGTKPFDGDTLQTIMYKIVSQSPPDVATLVPGLPPALNVIVQRALAKEPSARFPAALEMANALSTARAALPDSSAGVAPLSLRSTIEHALADEAASRKRRARQQRALTIGAGTIGLAAIVLLGMNLSNRARERASDAGQAPRVSPTSAKHDSGAATISQADGDARSQIARGTTSSTKSMSSGGKAESPDASRKPAGPSATNSPSSEELGLFRTLQATALQARRSAGDAGATEDQLEAGDRHNRSASALLVQGKLSQAAEQLNEAATAWAAAERSARKVAASVASNRASAPEQPRLQVVPPPTTLPSSPTTPANVPAPAAQPVQQSAGSAASDISNVVAGYARAIESRDLNAVRRIYTGLTPAQAKGFEDFFGSVRSLRVSFSVEGLEVTGATADARLIGVYEYVSRAGKSERQPLSFQATFRRESGGWTLVSVR